MGQCDVVYRNEFYYGYNDRDCPKEIKKGPKKWKPELIDKCYDIQTCYKKRDTIPGLFFLFLFRPQIATKMPVLTYCQSLIPMLRQNPFKTKWRSVMRRLVFPPPLSFRPQQSLDTDDHTGDPQDLNETAGCILDGTCKPGQPLSLSEDAFCKLHGTCKRDASPGRSHSPRFQFRGPMEADTKTRAHRRSEEKEASQGRPEAEASHRERRPYFRGRTW